MSAFNILHIAAITYNSFLITFPDSFKMSVIEERIKHIFTVWRQDEMGPDFVS